MKNLLNKFLNPVRQLDERTIAEENEKAYQILKFWGSFNFLLFMINIGLFNIPDYSQGLARFMTIASAAYLGCYYLSTFLFSRIHLERYYFFGIVQLILIPWLFQLFGIFLPALELKIRNLEYFDQAKGAIFIISYFPYLAAILGLFVGIWIQRVGKARPFVSSKIKEKFNSTLIAYIVFIMTFVVIFILYTVQISGESSTKVTYYNDVYKFSMEIPNSWTSSVGAGEDPNYRSALFTLKNGSNILDVFPLNSQDTYEFCVSETDKNILPYTGPIIEKSKITIDGKEYEYDLCKIKNNYITSTQVIIPIEKIDRYDELVVTSHFPSGNFEAITNAIKSIKFYK